MTKEAIAKLIAKVSASLINIESATRIDIPLPKEATDKPKIAEAGSCSFNSDADDGNGLIIKGTTAFEKKVLAVYRIYKCQ